MTPYLIIDIAGYVLSLEDQLLLENPCVAGVILFARNYQNLQQLKALTQHIHAIRQDALIMVDQEGGRVQRFIDGFTRLPPVSTLKNKQDLAKFIPILATELKAVGVDISLIPVLDLNYQKSEIIGERSLGRDAKEVATLASVMIDILHAHQMPSVGKHFPGHGAVTVDSHVALPEDSRLLNELMTEDLYPYQALIKKLDAVMPGHLVFPSVDAFPASLSLYWITHILREKLGFSGCVITDDLSMQALASYGSYETRARLALEAGCDLLLVCNYRPGVLEILETIGRRTHAESTARIHHFASRCRHVDTLLG